MVVDTGMTLYEFNKQAMNQFNSLDPIQFNLKTEEMINDLSKCKYLMLLNAERKDYTIFRILSAEGTVKELRPTLQNRGLILSIDKQENGAYEIWIRDDITKENFAYYLFDYSGAVIEA